MQKKMRSLIKQLWPFTTPQIGSMRTLTHSTPSPTAIASSTWYRSIHELPLHAWIRAEVHEELSALVTSGSPDMDEVARTWSEMQTDFRDAIGDTKTTMRLFIYKELALMSLQLQGIYIMIDGMRLAYHPFFHKELNKQLECDIQWDPNDREAHFAALQRYHKRTATIRRQIKLKEIEYESMKQGAVGPKPSDAYYQSVLITLTDFAKVPVTDQISTYTYCERVRRLNEYVRKSKSK